MGGPGLLGAVGHGLGIGQREGVDVGAKSDQRAVGGRISERQVGKSPGLLASLVSADPGIESRFLKLSRDESRGLHFLAADFRILVQVPADLNLPVCELSEFLIESPVETFQNR